MKLVLSLLGVVLLIVAAVYFLMPADQLPSFMPGHEAGVMRVHSKHGIVAGAAGIVLLVAGWWGIPWGPIYTIQSIYNNSRGGKDVTEAVANSLRAQAAPIPVKN